MLILIKLVKIFPDPVKTGLNWFKLVWIFLILIELISGGKIDAKAAAALIAAAASGGDPEIANKIIEKMLAGKTVYKAGILCVFIANKIIEKMLAGNTFFYHLFNVFYYRQNYWEDVSW